MIIAEIELLWDTAYNSKLFTIGRLNLRYGFQVGEYVSDFKCLSDESVDLKFHRAIHDYAKDGGSEDV